MQRTIFFLHSWLGIFAALFLLVVGLTGSLLVFKTELDRALAPEFVLRSSTTAPRLSGDVLMAKAKAQVPTHEILGWGLAKEADMNDLLYLGQEGEHEGEFAYLDPTTGQLTSEPEDRTALFTNWILALHYAFHLDHFGELLGGIVALVFVGLSLTGFYLYRKFWKHFFTLRWGRSLRILCSDIHKFVGIPSVVFNLVLGITGAYFNLSHLLYHLKEGKFEDDHLELKAAGWRTDHPMDLAFAKVLETQPNYQVNWVTFPQKAEEKLTFYGDASKGDVFRSGYGDIAMVDPTTGDVASMHLLDEGAWGMKLIDSFRPLHYGNFGGLTVQLLWCFAGLAPAVLSITGVMLFWKRRSKSKTRGNLRA